MPLGRTLTFHQKELKHEKHSASVTDVHKFSHHSFLLLSNYPQPIIMVALLIYRDVKLGFFLQPKLVCSKLNINRSSKHSG